MRRTFSSTLCLLVLPLLISCFSIGFSRPLTKEMDMNYGFLLKCEASSQVYPITKANAEKSTVLKRILESRSEAITVRAEENCEEGLPILIKALHGNKFKVNKQRFIQVFPLASQLDIEMVHKPCIKYFAESSPKTQLELISFFKDSKIQNELRKLVVFMANVRKIMTNARKNRRWKFDVEGTLDLSKLKLNNVTWLTDALSSGGLRHLKALNLFKNQISTFDISPELPLRLEKLKLKSNELLNADSIVHSLNQDKLPKLNALDLSDNEIASFPLEPIKSLSLEFLQLSHNKLQNIDALVPALNDRKLPNLTNLILSGNSICSWVAWNMIHSPMNNLKVFAYDFSKIEAFDDAEALVHAIQYMPILSSTDRDLIDGAFGKLSAIKIIVQRDNLYESTKIAFGNLMDVNLRQIRIIFNQESGQDIGGLTRDFVHQLSLEMVKPKHGIFNSMADDEDKKAGSLYYFSPYNEGKLEDYTFIGRFLAFSYLKKISLSIEFASVFYDLLVHADKLMTFEDYKNYDAHHYKIMERIKEKLDPNELGYFSFCVDEQPISDKYDCDTQVTIENHQEFFNAYANHMIKMKYEKSIKAISESFQSYFKRYRNNELPDPDTIRKILIPASHIVVTDLITHTIFKDFTTDEEEAMKRFYSEMLEEWNQTNEGKEKIEGLVLFIRGSKLPMTGWDGIPDIIFRKRLPDERFSYPVAHTCFFTLDIQPYTTKKDFIEGMTISLNSYRMTGGLMSMA